MGQNFSWIEQVGHRLDRQRARWQRAGKLWDEVWRIRVENGSICFYKPIKGHSKTTKMYFCLLICKYCTSRWRCWTDIEPVAYSNIAFPVSKRLSALLRHGDLLRKDDGLIEFWRLKDCLRYEITILDIGLMKCGNSLSPSSSRPFRTQSHWSFTTGQCVNSGQFLRVHFSHTMCSRFTLHNKFRIDTGRTIFEQKTDSILSACEPYG